MNEAGQTFVGRKKMTIRPSQNYLSILEVGVFAANKYLV